MSETPMQVENQSESEATDPEEESAAKDTPAGGGAETPSNEESMAELEDRDSSDDTLSIDSNESDVAFTSDKDPTDLIIKASTLKEEGNSHFKSGDLDKASRSYRKGTTVLKPLNKNNTGDDQVKALLVSLQTNLSMVCFKQNKPKLSLDVASQALKVDSSNVKALYRRAAANRKLGNIKEARDDLKEALKHDPNNVAVRKELLSIKKEVEEATAREKRQLQKAFSATSRSSFLYDDKEVDEQKREEEKKRKEEEAKEQLKKRKEEWENECVERMAKGGEAISFEDWEKERSEEEKRLEKQRKEEEKRKKEAEKKARAEAKASQPVVDDESDDELTEKELAMLRGYKKTSDGRTTSYFTRELSEEEKKLLGNTAPQKLDSLPAGGAAPVSPSETAEAPAGKQGTGSVWNQAGTWEETNTTEWCTSHLRSKLLSANTHPSEGPFVAMVTNVESLTGDASVAFTGGKKRYIFDYHAALLYEIKDDSDDEVIASGSFKLPDICSTSHDELEVDVLAWKKSPGSEHEADATECRTQLVHEVRVAVQAFVKDFNAQY